MSEQMYLLMGCSSVWLLDSKELIHLTQS